MGCGEHEGLIEPGSTGLSGYRRGGHRSAWIAASGSATQEPEAQSAQLPGKRTQAGAMQRPYRSARYQAASILYRDLKGARFETAKRAPEFRRPVDSGC